MPVSIMSVMPLPAVVPMPLVMPVYASMLGDSVRRMRQTPYHAMYDGVYDGPSYGRGDGR